MKYVLILFILNLNFCLKAKKSPFDISKPSLGMFGFILSSLNKTTTSSTSADTTPPTVTVTNLKSKGTIETGLLVGTASDNVAVASVEVQINSGSYVAATVTAAATWTYTLPPKLIWLSGNYNKINIRAKDTAGNQTISALSNLLKLPNQDFNGDGYADLIVSTPKYSTNLGRVYIFNGSSTGVNFTLASSASKTITGASGDKLGNAFTVGDFNGDGFPDLGVCAKRGLGLLNQAYVYLGTSSGLNATASWTINDATANNELCTAIKAGDFNGDGFDDLAITDLNGAGLIKIYNGSSNGISGASPFKTSVPTGGSNMGYVLAAGDINGDGFSDLVTIQSSTLQVLVFNGSATSILTNPDYALAYAAGTVAYTDVILMNDITGDGKLDLIYGTPTHSSNAGRVFIHTGNGSSFNSSPNFTITGGGGCCSGLSSFGNSLFVSDINEDGILDLLVGAYQYNNGGSNNGKIHLFYGGSSLTTGVADTVNNGYVYGETANPNWSSQFGSFISVRDVNADGVKDLIVGASAYVGSKGSVYIFLNVVSAFTSTLATSNTKVIVGEAASDTFGVNGL
jgi:hypothetical protein